MAQNPFSTNLIGQKTPASYRDESLLGEDRTINTISLRPPSSEGSYGIAISEPYNPSVATTQEMINSLGGQFVDTQPLTDRDRVDMGMVPQPDTVSVGQPQQQNNPMLAPQPIIGQPEQQVNPMLNTNLAQQAMLGSQVPVEPVPAPTPVPVSQAAPIGQGTVLDEPSVQDFNQAAAGAINIPNTSQMANDFSQRFAGQTATPAPAPTATPGTQSLSPEVAPGSPQANFLAQREQGALSPQQIAQAEEFARQMGTTFSPETGYSRDPFLSNQASRTSTPLPGQTLSQFMRYEDQPAQRTEQFVDPQGRLRRRMTPAASSLMGLPEGTQPLAPQYAGSEADSANQLSPFEQASLARQARIGGTGSFEGDSAAREARLAARPDFMEAQRSNAGQTMTDADRRDLAQASMPNASVGDIARGIEIKQRYAQPSAVDPLDRRLKEIELLQAQKNLLEEPKAESPSAFQEKYNLALGITGDEDQAFRMASGMEDPTEVSQPNVTALNLESQGEYRIPPSEQFPNGKIIYGGFATEGPLAGQVVYKPEGSEEFVPIPPNTLPYSQSASDGIINKLDETESDLMSTQSSMKSLMNYYEDVQGSPKGAEFAINQIFSTIKTLAGQDLTDEEILLRAQRGQFQQLLGQNRIDVLGPGVLTEYDAKRLEQALGSYGLNRDPSVVKKALSSIIQSKKSKELALINRFNKLRPLYPEPSQIFSDTNLKPLDTSILDDSTATEPSADGGAMTREQKQKRLEALRKKAAQSNQ